MLRLRPGHFELFIGIRIRFGILALGIVLALYCPPLMAQEGDLGKLGKTAAGEQGQGAGDSLTDKLNTAAEELAEEEVPSEPLERKPPQSSDEKPTLEELQKELPNGWSTFVEPGAEIFPSLVLALANIPKPPDQPSQKNAQILGDDDGWVGALVISPKAGAKVRLSVRCPDLMNESVLETVLPEGETLYGLYPTILWKFDVLRGIRQTIPAHIVFDLSIDGKAFPQLIQRVRVRTINDCPYYDDNSDDPVDMNWMFATYVNEDHPIVDQILKEALGTKLVNGFTGYQDEDPIEVYRQVFAIWTALRNRGIKYSSITTTAASSERVFSQHVRFLDESLGSTQANCVDGSVLFASILRKIGIEPFLVVLPNHCFLGFHLDDSGKKRAFLETTCLGTLEPEDVPLLSKLAKTLPEDVVAEKDWLSFKEAIKMGRDEYREHRKELKKESPEFQIVEIANARKAGIMPIARP